MATRRPRAQDGCRHPLDTDALRCECGCMVGRLGAGWVEVKCKRCKRLVLVPFAGGELPVGAPSTEN